MGRQRLCVVQEGMGRVGTVWVCLGHGVCGDSTVGAVCWVIGCCVCGVGWCVGVGCWGLDVGFVSVVC